MAQGFRRAALLAPSCPSVPGCPHLQPWEYLLVHAEPRKWWQWVSKPSLPFLASQFSKGICVKLLAHNFARVKQLREKKSPAHEHSQAFKNITPTCICTKIDLSSFSYSLWFYDDQSLARKQRGKVGECLSADSKNRMAFLQTTFLACQEWFLYNVWYWQEICQSIDFCRLWSICLNFSPIDDDRWCMIHHLAHLIFRWWLCGYRRLCGPQHWFRGQERDKLKCQFKRISLLRKTATDTSAGDLAPLATKQAKNTVIALSLSFL